MMEAAAARRIWFLHACHYMAESLKCARLWLAGDAQQHNTTAEASHMSG